MGCGDTPTSRRFSDSMAAGTIPLFNTLRYFMEEEGFSYGEMYAFRHGTAEHPHVAFPWKVCYDKLTVLVPELLAINTRQKAVEEATQEAVKSGRFAKMQEYLFEVRDDLIYGWGSPIEAAKDRKSGKTGTENRFGRAAENLVYEASYKIRNLPLPLLPLPTPFKPSGWEGEDLSHSLLKVELYPTDCEKGKKPTEYCDAKDARIQKAAGGVDAAAAAAVAAAADPNADNAHPAEAVPAENRNARRKREAAERQAAKDLQQ
jgi:hypothetical protein